MAGSQIAPPAPPCSRRGRSRAATLIQATYRGRRTRQKVVQSALQDFDRIFDQIFTASTASEIAPTKATPPPGLTELSPGKLFLEPAVPVPRCWLANARNRRPLYDILQPSSRTNSHTTAARRRATAEQLMLQGEDKSDELNLSSSGGSSGAGEVETLLARRQPGLNQHDQEAVVLRASDGRSGDDRRFVVELQQSEAGYGAVVATALPQAAREGGRRLGDLIAGEHHQSAAEERVGGGTMTGSGSGEGGDRERDSFTYSDGEDEEEAQEGMVEPVKRERQHRSGRINNGRLSGSNSNCSSPGNGENGGLTKNVMEMEEKVLEKQDTRLCIPATGSADMDVVSLKHDTQLSNQQASSNNSGFAEQDARVSSPADRSGTTCPPARSASEEGKVAAAEDGDPSDKLSDYASLDSGAPHELLLSRSTTSPQTAAAVQPVSVCSSLDSAFSDSPLRGESISIPSVARISSVEAPGDSRVANSGACGGGDCGRIDVDENGEEDGVASGSCSGSGGDGHVAQDDGPTVFAPNNTSASSDTPTTPPRAITPSSPKTHGKNRTEVAPSSTSDGISEGKQLWRRWVMTLGEGDQENGCKDGAGAKDKEAWVDRDNVADRTLQELGEELRWIRATLESRVRYLRSRQVDLMQRDALTRGTQQDKQQGGSTGHQ